VTNIDGPNFLPTHPNNSELERLGDQIAELAAHLDAATARLLDLIREFDARGGWGNGFRSARRGCHGASASNRAPLASTSAWPARLDHCRG
jgi:hypothetical protein